MNDWLHNLPIVWMALLVFGLTALGTTAIYVVVMALSVGERARSFKAVSPGLLSPLGILFALFIAFTATQVWSDNDKATSVVDREASALRNIVILAATFPGEAETRLPKLIRSYIPDAAAQEWPMMAHRTATLQIVPYSLTEALQLVLSFTPSGQGQQTAQREITTRLASAITMGLFGIGVAASMLLILAHDRPFTGELAVKPNPLLQVMPEREAAQQGIKR